MSVTSERRALVTIVFCDLAGSTALGERLDAEVLRGVQARYFDACSIALRRHGGQVEKFIGDAVMCVFGLPRAREDDALRGCRAALDLLSAVDALSDELDREFGFRLAVRVGVQSGEVVAGDPRRGQALVTGDPVNTAARLEQAAEPGIALIGELTERLVRDHIRATPAAPIAAKGKAAPVPAWRLDGARLDTTGRSSGGALIGRVRELQELQEALAEVRRSGAAARLIVTGEAGIGKSRLVGALLDGVAHDVTALRGRCPAYGDGITYWPLGEMVDEAAEVTDLEDRTALDIARALGREPGAVTRDDAFAAFARFFAAHTRSGPVVVLIEDLHWAEPTLLDLLEFLTEALVERPVLVIGTARPEVGEQRPSLMQAVVRLAPLPAEDARALLAARGVDGDAADEFLERAQGNPLFLEQLRAAAAEDGNQRLPADLRALLAARLDRLGSEERAVLDVAAVAGREFWAEALIPLLGAEAAAGVGAQLAVLQARELVVAGRADAAPTGLSGMFDATGRYAFAHALVHTAAYDALPRARLADLHERFAGVLEANAAERRGEYAAIIAWHVEQAAVLRAALAPLAAPAPGRGRAVALLQAAGEQAREHGDAAAADNLLSRAAALLEPGTEATPAPPTPNYDLLPVGSRFAGYEVLDVAGIGGMGIVYRAWDDRLGRAVALKLIAPAYGRDAEFRERFERESQIAASLEHPSIVTVYRAGEDEGRLFIAMRYVAGTDLSSLLRAKGPLAPTATANIIDQIARALDVAHGRGLVHRDIKPGNVLLTQEDGVHRGYLTDFGLTVRGGAQGELTRTGQWVGTLAYAAPEQIRGADIDARTDVYALGGVLHHCLTGQVPFPAERELDAISKHLADPPPRPSAINADVGKAFDQIVARALAKHPEERYASAGDLGRAALAASRGERLPRASRSVATGSAAPGGHRRGVQSRLRPLVAALAIAGIGAVAAFALSSGGSGGSTTGSNQPANPAGALRGTPIAVRQTPNHLAVLNDQLWAMTTEGGLLARLDPATRRVAYFPSALSLGGGPWDDIHAGFDALWAAHSVPAPNGGIDRIDPGTARALAHIPLAEPKAVTIGSNRVWAITSPGAKNELVAIDPKTDRVTKRVRVGSQPTSLAASRHIVWVADRQSGELLRIDAGTARVRSRVPLGKGTGVVIANAGNVWVGNLEERTLTRIDPASGQPASAAVSLGKEIDDMLLTSRALWVAGGDGTVTRLNPSSGTIVGTPLSFGPAPLTLTASGRDVWVASTSGQRLQRVEEAA